MNLDDIVNVLSVVGLFIALGGLCILLWTEMKGDWDEDWSRPPEEEDE